MSRWIRPKYNEQCKENAWCTKKSVLIDSRKVPEGYWLKVLRGKCPEGLGEVSENLKNSKDLVPEDFLDDKYAFTPNKATTIKYPECDEQNRPVTGTTRRLSVENNEVEKNDILSCAPGDDEDVTQSVYNGFKTPVLPKHHTTSNINVTPCLFSPELLSQGTQDASPKSRNLLNMTVCEDKIFSKLLESQNYSSTVSQLHGVQNSPENVYQRSPSILSLMMAEDRPRSSLALLSAMSSDDEIDGWSDSMATPPVQWSQSPQGDEDDVKEHKDSNEKQHVARTLFEGTKQEVSSGMSGFSILESGDEKNDTLSRTLLCDDEKGFHRTDNIVELQGVFGNMENSAKDCSLLKMINAADVNSLDLSLMADICSSDVLQKERIEFSKERKHCSCITQDCTCLLDGSGAPVLEPKAEEDTENTGISKSMSPFLSQPISLTMFPPSAAISSPISYSQEVQQLLDLAQSTPKISEKKTEEERCQTIKTRKFYKNNDNNNIKSEKMFDSDTNFLMNDNLKSISCGNNNCDISRTSFNEKDNNLMDSSEVLELDCMSIGTLMSSNLSSSSSSSCPTEANALAMISKPCCGGEVNDDMSFNMPITPKLASSSFPKEADSLGVTLKPRYGGEVYDVSFGSISASMEEVMVKETERVLTKTAAPTSGKQTETQFPNLDKQDNVQKLKKMTTERSESLDNESKKSGIEQKSASRVLGVRRSSRLKRFSYPTSRKCSKTRESIESKVNKGEDSASKNERTKELKVGSCDVKLGNTNEGKKDERSKEKVRSPDAEEESCRQEDAHVNQKEMESRQLMEKRNRANEPSLINDKFRSKTTENNAPQNTEDMGQELSVIVPSTGSEDYITEDMTDNTMISIQDDFKTPKKMSSNDGLYDMDALSQFPVELLSPTTSDVHEIGKLSFDSGEASCQIKSCQNESCPKLSMKSGFKTAGGKDVSISEEAMKKAKALFEMDNRDLDGRENNVKPKASATCTNSSMITTFKTACVNDAIISEKAKRNAKAMFEMQNKENTKQEHDVNRKSSNIKPSTMSGFKTAGGKDVSISEDAMKKAKAVFEMENQESIERKSDATTMETFDVQQKSSNTQPSTMSGYNTPGGKDVSTSEDAMKKAKAKFDMENVKADGRGSDVKQKVTKSSTMSGFKTAGGKDVSISEDAMKKAKAVFEMENQESIERKSDATTMETFDVQRKSSNTQPSTMSGYNTPGGKDVSTSEDAIKKAKAKFDMENRESDGRVSDSRPKENFAKPCMMSGFKTAGGKDVNISEEAMKKAIAMFEMENSESDGRGSDVKRKSSNIKPSTMSGFKTAGGKDVSISEEAMKKAKAMFEIENQEIIGRGSVVKPKTLATKSSAMSGFKTAGGKDVNISEEAMKRAKAMFEVENVEADGRGSDVKPKVTIKQSTMSGFKTAGGKDVSISEEAMKKTKAMFEMENKETCGRDSDKRPKENLAKPSAMSGFKTAGKKDVNISEETMKKAKAMLEIENQESIERDTDATTKENFDVKRKSSNIQPSTMSGFKTAGGKDVSISEEAMKKAKAMFEVEYVEADGRGSDVKPKVTINLSAMSGFKTAGGKDVSISEDAMKKAKAMFEMEYKESCGRGSDNRSKENFAKPSTMSGFKTAGGKDVSISEEAMKKAKAMFERENSECGGRGSDVKPKATINLFAMSGFKTAGGKDVSISEEAMKKAKALLEMENRESDGRGSDVKRKSSNIKPSTMSGFKTAGGKDVSISEEAMKKAKAMFEVENVEADGRGSDVKQKVTKQSTMSGFKTAGGKDVSISEEAMKKAKAMFDMENVKVDGRRSDNRPKEQFTKPSTMSGFKTAGGKDVNISEEAMKKAKAMFEVENKANEQQSNLNLKSKENENNETACVPDKENEPEPKSTRLEENSLNRKDRELEVTADRRVSSLEGSDRSQLDQEVPLFKILTPSKATDVLVASSKASSTKPSTSSMSNPRSSIVYSTPINDVDETLSREILESSAALIADESFTDFSECNPTQDERFLVSRGSRSERAKPSVNAESSTEMCQSESQLSKREALLAKARRRSAPFLSNGDRTSPSSLQTRSALMPMRSSPSGVLYDRRSKMFSPPLKPLVVTPNMSTPISSFPPARKEAKRLFVRQGSPMNPSTSSPTSPLAAEGRQSVNQRPHTTPNTGIPRKQFTTPYRSTSPLSSTTSAQRDKEKDGSPERKRARIQAPGSGSQTTERSGAKSDNRGRESIKPIVGYLYNLRQNLSTRMNLKTRVGNASPGRYTEQQLRDLGVRDDVMAVTSLNAESFRFVATRFFSEEICTSNRGIRTEDGGLVFLGEDGRIGLAEIEEALSMTPGVDVKLIPHGWIANHYRWIVWKLASMEMAFPQHFAGRCLTPDWVLCRLKYRYDREIDRSHRSALKKILERDDLCSRTMVLCVSSLTPTRRDTDDLNETGNPKTPNATSTHEASTVIELTDGWYSVSAILDAPLTNLLSKGKIFLGLKLCINGAELIGSDQAVSPLEAPSSLMLRITANSTRRARWNARLGFHSYSHPFPLPLSSLYSNGGVVGCVDVVVLRQYPVEYMEKLANGTTVFRNSRAEEREAKRFGRDLDRAREALLTKVQREFEEANNKSDARSSKKARSYSPKDITKLRNGKELYEAYDSSSDPSFIEECLDDNQRSSLEEYRRSLHDSRRAELENMFQRAWDENEQNISKRTVVPMLKVRLVNYYKSDQDKTEAILSVWRPNEDVFQLLSEGTRLRIYHVMASGSRYRQGLPSLQLSSTRSTRYKTMSIDHDMVDDLYSTRQTTSFDELQSNPPALYSEVDLVGVVIAITSHNSSSLQTVYLSDGDQYIVAVKFWGGLKTYALDDLVKLRGLVACSNLVVRSNEHAHCPTLAFNELSIMTLKPREAYLRTALDDLSKNIQEIDMFMDIAQETLDKIRRPGSTTLNMESSRVPGKDSPLEDSIKKGLVTDRANSDNTEGTSPEQCDSAPNRAQIVRDKILVPTPVTRPLSGQCKRKLLDCIPEPPATPSLNVTVSESVRRDFKRPRRLATGSPQ